MPIQNSKACELVTGLAELGADMEGKFSSFEVTDAAIDLVNGASCFIQQQDEEIQKLRAALEFYADDENYVLQPLKDEVEGQLIWVTPIAHENYGDRARKALEGEG